MSLLDGLQYSLAKNGFIVETARTVKEAGVLLKANRYSLLLLDVSLPDGTGFDICERVRSGGSRMPIIFLTAADEEVNIIRGLDSGGDDYITKPFKLGELCSRIRALLCRAGMEKPENTGIPKSGSVMVDLLGSRVLKDGALLELTGAEYRLLCLHQVETAKELLEHNRGIAAALLERGIPEDVIAESLMNEAKSEEGDRLLQTL